MDIIEPLRCDIFLNKNRLLLNLVDLKIKLIHSEPKFCLVADKSIDATTPEPNFKVILEQVFLFICKVSPGLLLGHAKALEKLLLNT